MATAIIETGSKDRMSADPVVQGSQAPVYQHPRPVQGLRERAGVDLRSALSPPSLATTASATKTDLVNDLGADVVIDTVGGENLDKSPRVLKPGRTVISITGPPDPGSAREVGANPVVRLAVAALSYRIRRRARRHQVTYSYEQGRTNAGRGRHARDMTAPELPPPVARPAGRAPETVDHSRPTGGPHGHVAK